MAKKGEANWKPGDPIGYIRQEIPGFSLPAYEGDRYEAMVPDTYDLQERAALVVHAMTEATDPLADHEPYYAVYFRTDPAVMLHSSWHGATWPKFPESVGLMRLVSGTDENLHVDEKWMEVALKSQGSDGLIYTPMKGRPWAYWDVAMGSQVRERDLFGVRVDDEQIICPMGAGRLLSTMALYASRDGSGVWRDAARRLADGLVDLAVDEGDFAHYWPHVQLAIKERPADSEVRLDQINFDGYSRVVYGLVHGYRLLGHEPALELASKFSVFMRRYFFAEDGCFWSSPGNPRMAHFHGHSNALLAMQANAADSGDDDLMEFVVRGFERGIEYARNTEKEDSAYVSSPGGDLIGYFPEHVESPEWEGAELCEVADMIAVALALSDAGIGDYWDDADRWTRNMFAEGQLLSTDWIDRVPEGGFRNPRERYRPRHVPDEYATADRVAERNVGSFAGWPSANDWYVGNGMGIMHCCTVNAARALYWIWRRMLRYDDGKLRINLLFNRCSRWADVDSYIPYQGRADVKVKLPVDLSVRIPEWVAPGETRASVNGQNRRIGWDGRYAKIGSVKPGDLVTLTFPINEGTVMVHIEKEQFTLVRKGNDVVYIDPPGRYCPLYQRDHYRSSEPRWRKIERFVTNEDIEW